MPALPGKDHGIDMRRALTLLALCALASRAHAFERDLTPEGVAPAFRAVPAWPRLVADLPGVPREEAEEALRSAARGWLGVPGSWFSFDGPDDGRRPWIRVEVYQRGWPHDPRFVAHTERSYQGPPGTIASAVIRLNAEHHRFCGRRCAGELPLGPVLLHELGHALGLAHSGVRGSVMAPGLGREPSAAPTALGPDDQRGLQAIYGGPTPPPLASPAPAPSPPSGRWITLAVLLMLAPALFLAARRRARHREQKRTSGGARDPAAPRPPDQ